MPVALSGTPVERNPEREPWPWPGLESKERSDKKRPGTESMQATGSQTNADHVPLIFFK